MNPKYLRSDDAIFAPVGSDIVALHIPQGRCYGMEGVTAAVWELIDEPRDLESICAQLQEVYSVDSAECRSDVQSLMALLRTEGLVDVVGEVEPV